MLNRRSAACLLLLTGCTGPGLSSDTALFVTEVQEATRSTCSLIPAAGAIVSLASIIFPNMTSRTAPLETAQRICAGFLGEPNKPAPIVEGDIVNFEVEGIPIEAVVLS